MTSTIANLAAAVDDAVGRLSFVAGTALMGHYCDDDASWQDTDDARAARQIVDKADALFAAACDLARVVREAGEAGILAHAEGSAGIVADAEIRTGHADTDATPLHCVAGCDTAWCAHAVCDATICDGEATHAATRASLAALGEPDAAWRTQY